MFRARTLLWGLFFCPAATAAGRDASGTSGTDAPRPASDGAYQHDGFFLRMTAGLGVMETRFRDGAGTRARGAGPAFSIAMGGTPVRGLVLGGHFSTLTALSEFSATFGTYDGKTVSNAFGPFLAFYPSDRGGLYVEMTAGLVGVSRTAPRGGSESGAGLQAGAGLGYEFWVRESWSLGPLLRAAYETSSLLDERSSTRFAAHGGIFSLVFDVTYH